MLVLLVLPLADAGAAVLMLPTPEVGTGLLVYRLHMPDLLIGLGVDDGWCQLWL